MVYEEKCDEHGERMRFKPNGGTDMYEMYRAKSQQYEIPEWKRFFDDEEQDIKDEEGNIVQHGQKIIITHRSSNY